MESVLGASGKSSIGWFHAECLGSLCDACSLNTLSCHLYSGGIFARLSLSCSTIPPMKYWGLIGLGMFRDHRMNLIFSAPGALNTRSCS